MMNIALSTDYQPRAYLTLPQKRIIEATIAHIATEGYAHTSIGDIARKLKQSKGALQYHFPTKESLMQETIAYIYNVAFQDIRPNIDATDDAWERMRQFIEGSVAFYVTYPMCVKALGELMFNFRPTLHRSQATTRYEKELIDVALLLREGQKQGLFRSFDVDIMAVTIRHCLDGLIVKMSEPRYDIARHKQELIDFIRGGILH